MKQKQMTALAIGCGLACALCVAIFMASVQGQADAERAEALARYGGEQVEARPQNAEGTGEVTIRQLVINALRMRPDRIVISECRGEEALDMLTAMNTGHEVSLTTPWISLFDGWHGARSAVPSWVASNGFVEVPSMWF